MIFCWVFIYILLKLSDINFNIFILIVLKLYIKMIFVGEKNGCFYIVCIKFRFKELEKFIVCFFLILYNLILIKLLFGDS